MYDTIDEADARFEAARRRGEAFAAEVLAAAEAARFEADMNDRDDELDEFELAELEGRRFDEALAEHHAAMAERAAGWSA